MRDYKKGVSPVVATILLISIAIILAVIVFIWAKGFVGEVCQKNQRPPYDACSKISLKAAVSGSTLTVTNNGNIPVYSLEVMGTIDGDRLREAVTDQPITVGETITVELSSITSDAQDIEIYPVILSECGDVKLKKTNICKDNSVYPE